MTQARTLPSTQLAQHARSMRQPALALGRDAHLADDALQHSMLEALRRGTPPHVGAGAWLAGIVRRAAASALRAELRTRDRQPPAAPREALPSTLELVERTAIQQLVPSASLELDEPYRSAIMLRCIEGLPPR